MAAKREIYVYAHWEGIENPALIGVLWSERLRGKEIFSFQYDEEWLKSDQARVLDPELELYSGLHYPKDEKKPNFGMFTDSSPDRWGRILMKRREAAMARTQDRKAQTLFETDYLLGVFDGHRMGALRFKEDMNGSFLNDNAEMATPPWASLRELEQISLQLEKEDAMDDPDYLKWLNMLVSPGASLGGTRPKASITDTDGALWIAKFPSRSDEFDIGGWEMVAYEMAIQAGIDMAESQVRKFTSDQHTFMTKRFDRNPKGERIHFASAMTLLGYTDGTDHHQGASYLELAEFLTTHGSNVNQDLEELWRRIVFSICISNTDDHLRNHGFLLTERGWKLSPAYDINPIEDGTGLTLNISDEDNALDLDLVLEVSEFFRLKEEKAVAIVNEVKTVVSGWGTLANKYGLSRNEQELKASAFLF